MRLSKAWIVAAKDFRIFMQKKSIIYSIAGFELFISIGLPLIIKYANTRKNGFPVSVLPGLINSFSFWFVIGAAMLPMSMASYSLIGEKIQKSLEPLLASPITDDEILAGKAFSAFIPAIATNFIGALIFMLLVDKITYNKLTYLYFPNWNIAVTLLLLAPLVSVLSIGVNVLISSRFNDIRATQQMGALILLPLGGIYVLSEMRVISLSVSNLLIMAAVLTVVDIAVFSLVKTTFQREEILTRWK